MCTSAPGFDHTLAVSEAIFVELPLAAAAIWLAVALSPKGVLTRHTNKKRGDSWEAKELFTLLTKFEIQPLRRPHPGMAAP